MAYKFNGFVIADIITLLVAIALLVILIVVLTRNSLPGTTCTGTDADCTQQKLTKLDNKVNWLYALEIAGVGLMILAGVLAFFRVRSWVC